jgi:hypothetical protein
MIEQMGELLIALRNRVLGRSVTRQELSDGFARVASQTGIDLGLARSATPETLQLLVAPTGEVEPGRCWLVAEMLAVDGLQWEAEHRPDEARASYERARALFSLLEPGGAFLVGLPEASDRVGELTARLEALRPHDQSHDDSDPSRRP